MPPNICGRKQIIIDKITKGNFKISEEFYEEFSIGSEINSYSIPFYSATKESTILQYVQYMTKIKISNFKTEEHLMFISLLADVTFSRWLFEQYPDFGDYRLFDWLLYELLFSSSINNKHMILDAIINYYNYSHFNYNMDLLLLKHFYLQLETFMSIKYKNEEMYLIKEISYLIDIFNKKMFNNYSGYIYHEYCQNMSILNPLNLIRLIKINSILGNIHSSISNKNETENIETIIDNSSRLKIKSVSDDIYFDSYCVLFYHFILKKQCFINVVNSLSNETLTQNIYRYKITDSKYVFFVIIPHATLN